MIANRPLLLLLGVLLLSCRGQSGPLGVDSVAVEALRFPHQRHSSIACTECHALRAVLDGKSQRPGGTEHESCDRDQCHAAAFRGPPSELCSLCHEGIAFGANGESPLLPYPPTSGSRSQAVGFSHARHLDAARMEERLGFHVSCTDCHISPPQGRSGLQRPDHAACGRCHAPEAAPTGTPAMGDCLGCHQNGAFAPPRQRAFITGDLHFSHRRHRNDRRGALISCATCHERSAVATKEDVGEHAAPSMNVCVTCHDDRERVPRTKRMRRCGTCHSTRSAGLGALAPRSHMPATERPRDHTRAFRRDHAADARADAQRCARCHPMLSGNRRDTCDECHQVMRPSDHVVTWREFDHGPEAATEAERCTTCHQADFCVGCHRTPPRSHFPRSEFRVGGHGTQAALNMRACITCHQPARDCSGLGCHRRDL